MSHLMSRSGAPSGRPVQIGTVILHWAVGRQCPVLGVRGHQCNGANSSLFLVVRLPRGRLLRMRTSERTRLIGILIGYAETDPALQSQLAAFRDALTKLGWTDGRNLRIELRWAAGNPDRMKTLAKELVELRPDAIPAQTTSVTSALMHEIPTIPIVFVSVAGRSDRRRLRHEPRTSGPQYHWL